jgi:sugar lactone lactonase YvrE
MAIRGEALWVADSNTSRVVRLDRRSGRVVAVSDAGFTLPRGLAVDAEGRVWVADVFGRSVSLLDADGHLLGRFGGQDVNGSGALASGPELPQPGVPEGLVLLAQRERLYVTDSSSGLVRVYSIRLR